MMEVLVVFAYIVMFLFCLAWQFDILMDRTWSTFEKVLWISLVMVIQGLIVIMCVVTV